MSNYYYKKLRHSDITVMMATAGTQRKLTKFSKLMDSYISVLYHSSHTNEIIKKQKKVRLGGVKRIVLTDCSIILPISTF